MQGFRRRITAIALGASSAIAWAGDTGNTLAGMDWLLGRWQRIDLPAGESGHENWRRADDGSLVGSGVHERTNGRRFEEKLQIALRDGTAVYIAETPQNEAPVVFVLTRSDSRGMVFENPAHDFPKRIAYRRIDEDDLIVRIDGDGTAVDFTFRRID